MKYILIFSLLANVGLLIAVDSIKGKNSELTREIQSAEGAIARAYAKSVEAKGRAEREIDAMRLALALERDKYAALGRIAAEEGARLAALQKEIEGLENPEDEINYIHFMINSSVKL